MTVGGLIPSQTYKDLVACEDNTAVTIHTVVGVFIPYDVTTKYFAACL